MSLQPPESVRPWLTAPVAIFGGGVSGVGVCAILAELGASSVIYDTKGALFAFGAAKSHRLVVYSPGFPPEHPWLDEARAAGCVCLSELDFASLFWRGSLVAITGTNGKTTLTEFLTHALREAGRTAHATGNIGHSFSELVAQTGGGAGEDIAVCEVSSFQAEALQHFGADATLWTNFAEDHLERHAGLESYFAAKWNLVVHTGGRVRPREETPQKLSATEAGRAVFVGSSVQRFAEKFDRPLPPGSAIATEQQPGDERLAGTVFQDYPQRENFLLAAAWWKFAGLPSNKLFSAAKNFQLGRHRLTRVGEREGVVYWNDSKATNFHAVEAAVAGFSSPVVLIAGGKSKGGDLAGFVHRIAPAVKHAVLIGDTAEELAFHCSAFRLAHTRCPSLAEAVDRAAELATAGDNVLLSPGFASFDQFKGYADRGEQFEKLVNNLEPARHPEIGVSRKF
jgi:UDP-N-acetylmuramoylalanine--D-glutamate ligase